MTKELKIINKLEDVAIKFEGSFLYPLVQAALQFEPIGFGGATEVILSTTLSSIRSKRFFVLMDELSKGEKELTSEIIESEDFVYNFLCVSKAAVNTRKNEKIEMLARLLLNSSIMETPNLDKFDEFLSILDDLFQNKDYLKDELYFAYFQ